jgi:hypothetical protein
MKTDHADHIPGSAQPQTGAALDHDGRSTAAERALAEAAARRAQIDARTAALPPEHGARREREPVRYGDWETKGIASDF